MSTFKMRQYSNVSHFSKLSANTYSHGKQLPAWKW